MGKLTTLDAILLATGLDKVWVFLAVVILTIIGGVIFYKTHIRPAWNWVKSLLHRLQIGFASGWPWRMKFIWGIVCILICATILDFYGGQNVNRYYTHNEYPSWQIYCIPFACYILFHITFFIKKWRQIIKFIFGLTVAGIAGMIYCAAFTQIFVVCFASGGPTKWGLFPVITLLIFGALVTFICSKFAEILIKATSHDFHDLFDFDGEKEKSESTQDEENEISIVEKPEQEKSRNIGGIIKSICCWIFALTALLMIGIGLFMALCWFCIMICVIFFGADGSGTSGVDQQLAKNGGFGGLTIKVFLIVISSLVLGSFLGWLSAKFDGEDEKLEGKE